MLEVPVSHFIVSDGALPWVKKESDEANIERQPVNPTHIETWCVCVPITIYPSHRTQDSVLKTPSWMNLMKISPLFFPCKGNQTIYNYWRTGSISAEAWRKYCGSDGRWNRSHRNEDKGKCQWQFASDLFSHFVPLCFQKKFPEIRHCDLEIL